MDPFLFVARDGQAFVLTNPLEAERISRALPDAELLGIDELGIYELVEDGMPRDEAELETAIRALSRWGIEDAVVPADLRSRSPIACATRASASTSTRRRWRRAAAPRPRRSWQASGVRSALPRPAWRPARRSSGAPTAKTAGCSRTASR